MNCFSRPPRNAPVTCLSRRDASTRPPSESLRAERELYQRLGEQLTALADPASLDLEIAAIASRAGASVAQAEEDAARARRAQLAAERERDDAARLRAHADAAAEQLAADAEAAELALAERTAEFDLDRAAFVARAREAEERADRSRTAAAEAQATAEAAEARAAADVIAAREQAAAATASARARADEAIARARREAEEAMAATRRRGRRTGRRGPSARRRDGRPGATRRRRRPARDRGGDRGGQRGGRARPGGGRRRARRHRRRAGERRHRQRPRRRRAAEADRARDEIGRLRDELRRLDAAREAEVGRLTAAHQAALEAERGRVTRAETELDALPERSAVITTGPAGSARRPLRLGRYGSRARGRTPCTRRSPRTSRPPSRPASTRRRRSCRRRTSSPQRYGVSRGTIRQAFAALRADGVIASRRGARRVVFGGPRVQSFGELLSFSRWARAAGEIPGGQVISLDRRPATPLEAARLAIGDDAAVYALVRVRLLSGRPVMVERAVYPDKVGVLVAGLDLTQDSITERLEELGVVFTDAEHVIDAVAASAEDARWLRVRAGVPLLRERRFTTDRAGQPVEWSDDRYLSTETAFSVRNSITVNALSRTPPPAQ